MCRAPYKFVTWDIKPLSEYTNTKIYQMHQKVLNGESLDDEENVYLYSQLSGNIYSSTGVPIGGWMYDFTCVLKEYYVELVDGYIFKTYAPSEKAIYAQHENVVNIVPL